MARTKTEVEPDQTIEETPEKEVVEPDAPQKYVCIKDCIFENLRYKPGDSLTWEGEMLNKNFQLASIPVMPPVSVAVSALNRDMQSRIRDLISLNGLYLDEELKKMGISSLAAFPPVDAHAYIEKLSKKYEKKKRQDRKSGRT